MLRTGEFSPSLGSLPMTKASIFSCLFLSSSSLLFSSSDAIASNNEQSHGIIFQPVLFVVFSFPSFRMVALAFISSRSFCGIVLIEAASSSEILISLVGNVISVYILANTSVLVDV
jgi:hypothetical protein